ncbi:DUF3883 domain-containing protein [Hymenobacter sp. BT175]|uniref:protein NO VEIN domain-containing protein n=1 Tax=Hymenobacter translucens TaxID=2886507 RepID=UPI001D0DD790|nr:DUF3883 domain-containing protein [Hymenobacter translucens]MCC2548496.1 DUF3883 domain-containing protein [Hymenobacter translucens]
MPRLIFFNTGWMDSYAGNPRNLDPITGGGAHTKVEGWGGEIFNFKPYRGKYYGYVRTTHGGDIRLERLGATKAADRIEGVTVVWTAPRPVEEGGGSCIVGWYKNATLFRAEQQRPTNSRHLWNEHLMGYYATAAASDVVLLPCDSRLFSVPRSKPKSMGQSNVWYADDDANLDFVRQVVAYLANDGILTTPTTRKKTKSPRQPDLLKRLAVEQKAVETTWDYYQKLGYTLESVEAAKVGWDLTATNGKVKLKLEVKGLSGTSVVAELTANEFTNLLADKPNYRVCIVTNALIKPLLHIFSYSKTAGCWVSQEGVELAFEEVTSARVFAI